MCVVCAVSEMCVCMCSDVCVCVCEVKFVCICLHICVCACVQETTGRVVVWRECDIGNSYTLEASFAGANFGAKSGVHMNIDDFEAMGAALCHTSKHS